MFFNEKTLNELIKTTQNAGDIIIKHYREYKHPKIKLKDNNTPVTKTDIASHNFIIKALNKMTPTIPILSEESPYISYAEKQKWNEYWLIDPLDGTKGFINKTDDFCICLAYIKNNIPIFGMVYVPITSTHYYANEHNKAYKLNNNKLKQIKVTKPKNPLRVVVGRYSTTHTRIIQHLKNITKNGKYNIKGIGSAIKICLIAEGKFDYYPGLGICSEWDTAAAGYILTAAGGHIHDFYGKKIKYNINNDMISPVFFASGAQILSRKE